MRRDQDPAERTLQNAKDRLRRFVHPARNQKAILDFSDFCFAEGLSTRRVLKYVGNLCTIAKRFSKDFHKATRKDIQALVEGIERSHYSDWTKHDFRVALKKFYRWLRGTEDYPDEVKWLRTGSPAPRQKLPDDLLTPNEIKAMIAAAKSSREKALIATLYESGCRPGEILSLQVKQVQQHPHGLQITVKGKKRPRRLLLVACAQYLTAWLNDHPRSHDPEALLWLTADYRAEPMAYSRFTELLKQIARRAGVNKAVNPYNFRHSRATQLANHLTEAQMNEYLGWVQGSDMPSTYVHLSGRDIDAAILKIHNVNTPNIQDNKETFSLKNCPRCDLKNPPGHKFCSRCGTVLDEQTARQLIQQDLERRHADEVMDRLIQDEEFRAFVDKKLKQLGIAKA